MKKILAVFLFVFAVADLHGAGFGLYEMSARAMMNGGYRMGKAVDASAVYYNPATQSGLTGTWATVGITLLHPPLDTRVNGVGTHKMDPGWFPDPAAFLVMPLTSDLSFGLGAYADFGLGSHYDNSWPLAWDSVETMVAAYTVSPTLSYKITEKWSVAAGVRLIHLVFDQRRIFRWGELNPMIVGTPYDGQTKVHYSAHNDVDVGYLIGTTYDFTDDFSVGAVWRSRARMRVDGHGSTSGYGGYHSAMASSFDGKFSEKIDLPMSAQVGFNWDNPFAFERWHLAGMLTWTEWSTIDEIGFGPHVMDLGWHNAYRAGFGIEYDVNDDWTCGVGYAYDWDPTREKRPATMLPAGDRHNIYFGVAYKLDEHWTLSLMGGMVLMESKTAWYDNPVTGQKNAYKFQTRNSHTYLASATVSYAF